MSALAHWQAQHARVQDAAAAPWLRALRADAWQRFEAQGLPGRRDEEWKYTRLAALERAQPQAAPVPQALPAGLPSAPASVIFSPSRVDSLGGITLSTLPCSRYTWHAGAG